MVGVDMKAIIQNNNKSFLFVGVIIGIAVLLPFIITKPYYLHVLTMCLLWAYLASSWNILCGYAGQLSLGHGMFTALGAYTAVVLFNDFGVSPWIGMFAGGAVAIIFSLIIGFPTFHLRGAYYALATVALSEGLVVLIDNTAKIGSFHIGGAEGLIVKMMGNAPAYFQFMSKVPYYYIALVMLIIVVLVSRWLINSRLGYYLLALKEDEDAAKALGINVRKSKLIAAAMSAFFTAIGGVFYAMIIHYLQPSAIAGGSMSTQMVFLAIVGGSGTVLGPVVGGITLSLISEIVRFYLGGSIAGLHLLIYGVIVMLIIMFKPEGVIGVLEKYYNRFFGPSNQEEDQYSGKDSSRG